MSAPPVPSKIAAIELPSPQLLKGKGHVGHFEGVSNAAAKALLEEARALRRLLG